MRILLAGSTGYIGSRLLLALRNDGHEVFQYYRGDTVKRGMDCVVNLAGYFVSNHTLDDIDELIDSNVKLVAHLLEAGCPQFIQACTYWKHCDNRDYAPVNLYAATKKAAEDIIKYYSEVRGTKTITLELQDVYGEGDTRDRLVQRLLRGGEIELTDGWQYINPVHVDDVVEGFRLVLGLLSTMEAGKHHRYALPSSEHMTLRRFVDLFNEVRGNTVVPLWGAKPYGGREFFRMYKLGSTRALLGWTPKVELREGIKRL